jgi:hypothetical protein
VTLDGAMATNGLHRGRLPGLTKLALRLFAAVRVVYEGVLIGRVSVPDSETIDLPTARWRG